MVLRRWAGERVVGTDLMGERGELVVDEEPRLLLFFPLAMGDEVVVHRGEGNKMEDCATARIAGLRGVRGDEYTGGVGRAAGMRRVLGRASGVSSSCANKSASMDSDVVLFRDLGLFLSCLTGAKSVMVTENSFMDSSRASVDSSSSSFELVKL